MSRTEAIIIGAALGLICPLLTFVVCWWSVALVHLHIVPIPTAWIITAAFLGLAIGVLFDLLFIRKWTARFYTASGWLLVAIYLSLCVVAVAFFMGVPIGTLSLGIAAGVYAGRRAHHSKLSPGQLAGALQKVALFAALITTGAAFPIGFLALQEQGIVEWLAGGLGWSALAVQGIPGHGLILLLCCALFAIQFWCTGQAGRMAYRLNGERSQVA